MQTQLLDLLRFLRAKGMDFSLSEIKDFFLAIDQVELKPQNLEEVLLCTVAKDKESYLALPLLLNFYLKKQEASGKVIPAQIRAEQIKNNPPRLSKNEFEEKLSSIKNYIRVEQHRLNSAVAACNKVTKGEICFKSSAAKAYSSIEQVKEPVITKLWQLDIAAANTDQLNEISKILAGLGPKLAAAKGYRKKPSSTGSIDIRRTVKKAAAGGGVPVLIKKAKRIPIKPHIVALCDLSGSVSPYSQFFLQLLISMQHQFKSIKSFAFVDRIEEITGLVKAVQANSLSARDIIRGVKISATGFSDYGSVWDQFYNFYSHVLNKQTNLIILGDARNNWKPDGVEYFSRLCLNSRKVIWLNPLPMGKWCKEDCILGAYEPYCNSVLPCANAAQLAAAIKNII